MKSIRDRLDEALAEAGQQWSEDDRERGVQIVKDLAELQAKAMVGQDVDSSQAMVNATVAQIRSTTSRQARSFLRSLFLDLSNLAVVAVTRGLSRM